MRRVLHRIGRRGACLLVFAFVDIAIGMALISPTASTVPAYRTFDSIAPLTAWAGLWLGTAAVLAVSAFLQRDQFAFGAAITIKILWAAGYVAAQLDGVPRAWLGAAVWMTVALLVFVIAGWPEPRKTVVAIGGRSNV